VRRGPLLFAGLSAVVVVVGACSYDWTFVAPSDQEPADGGKDAKLEEESSTPPPPEPPPVPPGTECKGNDGCGAKQFCLFKDGLCGRGTPGFCTEISDVCDPPTPNALCACDGTKVNDRCEAAMKGLDIDEKGAACSGSTFACPGVPSGCKAGLQFCQVKETSPSDGACINYTTCKPPSVSCAACQQDLPKPPCACKDVGTLELHVSCPPI